MLTDPTVEDMLEKLEKDGTPVSRFELCSLAAKRARQIISNNQNGYSTVKNTETELSRACKDIAEGKVVISKD